MDTTQLLIRPAIAEDAAYILSSWTRSYHRDFIGNFFRPWELYLPAARDRIANILARDTTNVIVAVQPEEPDIILGYLVWEEDSNNQNIIHYVQTRGGWKRKGIAKFLLRKAGIDVQKPLFVSAVTDIISCIACTCDHKHTNRTKYTIVQGDFTD